MGNSGTFRTTEKESAACGRPITQLELVAATKLLSELRASPTYYIGATSRLAAFKAKCSSGMPLNLTEVVEFLEQLPKDYRPSSMGERHPAVEARQKEGRDKWLADQQAAREEPGFKTAREAQETLNPEQYTAWLKSHQHLAERGAY